MLNRPRSVAPIDLEQLEDEINVLLDARPSREPGSGPAQGLRTNVRTVLERLC